MINGIKAMAKPFTDALKWFTDHVPGSPVKRGPLKVFNNGYAGSQIGEMLAGGMESSVPVLMSAASTMVDAVSSTLSANLGVGVASAIKQATATMPSAATMAPTTTATLPGGGYAGSEWTGSKTYNFYGDLEFPNITSGEDAQTFLENLEALAK